METNFNLEELVRDYIIYVDTCSLMCEGGIDFFQIQLLSELKKQNKKIRLLKNVRGELIGLTKDSSKINAATRGLKIIEAYENFGVIDNLPGQNKVIADRAFLHELLDARLEGNVCLITEDRRLAKDLIINIKNIDCAPAKYDLKCVRLLFGYPKYWDISQIDSQLGLSEIDDYTIMNENHNYKLLLSFVIDNSASMMGDKMTAFNKAFIEFTDRLKNKDIDKNIEYSINIYEGFEPKRLKDFTDDIYNKASLIAGRMPFMGKSLNNAIDRLGERIQEIERIGIKLYKPWLVVFSDGLSFDNVDTPIAKIEQLNNGDGVVYLPFMLSENEICNDLSTFKNYKGKRPLIVDEMKYKDMFDWLYLTLAKRLSTPISEHFTTDKELLKGWAK